MTSASSAGGAPGSSAARRRRAIAFSRRNFFQSLTLVLTSRSVTICSRPYPASATAAHQGAPETGQNASAANGASFVAIAPLACIQARESGSARR